MSASHRFRNRILALATQRRTLFTRRDILRQGGTMAAALATLPLLEACDSGPVAGPVMQTSVPAENGSLPPIANPPASGSSSGGSSSSSSSGGSSSSSSGGAVSVPAPTAAAFNHSVASGDPLTDRVILWTRVTPNAEATQVKVDYVVSKASTLADPVASGSFVTSGERDFTVKFDQGGLTSYTTYYFQFAVTQADGVVKKSPIGRTKTAPKTGDTDRLRIVSASCQNMGFGYFNAHAAMAAKAADLDVMLFLGDYIYETGGASQIAGRSPIPAKEITTLTDYRQRHAQYKTDPDLQALHRQIPWICVWDDHETTNNSYRASADNHTPGTEGCWEERMGWAIRAYFEWMPIRDNASTAFDAPTAAACPEATGLSGYLPEGNGNIQRSFRYGQLVDVLMLDTRLQGRDIQNGTNIVTEAHTMLGKVQRERFLAELSASTAQWKLIGQQMTFAPIKLVPLPEAQGGTYFNSDAWDGYRFDRNAVMKHLGDNAIRNVVFLSGDTHVVTAFDVPVEPSDPRLYNPATGAGSLAVEFSNSGVANVGVINEAQMANNPHLKYANLAERGYLLLDITAARVQGEYFFTGAPQLRSAVETFQRALVCNADSQRLTPGTTASTARTGAPPLAP